MAVSNPQPNRALQILTTRSAYVRLQRQKKILNMRLKVPPAIAQFQHVADRNLATQAFKILNKYRPETKAEKKTEKTEDAAPAAAEEKPVPASETPEVAAAEAEAAETVTAEDAGKSES